MTLQNQALTLQMKERIEKRRELEKRRLLLQTTNVMQKKRAAKTRSKSKFKLEVAYLVRANIDKYQFSTDWNFHSVQKGGLLGSIANQQEPLHICEQQRLEFLTKRKQPAALSSSLLHCDD